jgi:hypothetical protein
MMIRMKTTLVILRTIYSYVLDNDELTWSGLKVWKWDWRIYGLEEFVIVSSVRVLLLLLLLMLRVQVLVRVWVQVQGRVNALASGLYS